jgi:surfactin synthase thioesterase subunit
LQYNLQFLKSEVTRLTIQMTCSVLPDDHHLHTQLRRVQRQYDTALKSVELLGKRTSTKYSAKYHFFNGDHTFFHAATVSSLHLKLA